MAHEILVSAQGPLVLVLGLRVWGQGLTILSKNKLLFLGQKLDFQAIMAKSEDRTRLL